MFDSTKNFLSRDLWSPERMEGGRLKAAGVRALRIGVLALQDLYAGRLTLRATSLVYTTLLSLVPLLAVSFSVLKAFGVHNLLEPTLLNFVAPLGPKGAEVVERIVRFVENMRVGVLGSLGLALLLYTVISLIQQVEAAFNQIWRVTRPRTFARRFSDYLSVLLVGPVLIFAAIGLTASITSNVLFQKLVSIEPFGTAIVLLGAIAPYLFIIGAFTFVYVFVPNTHVRLRSALVGGLVAGVLWQTVGLLFASFAAGSTRYDAIYSSFAILILFMTWLYLNWIILLFGGQIAYYHQHPEQVYPGHHRLRPSQQFREHLALLLLGIVTADFYRDGRCWTLERLTHHIGMPADIVDEVVGILEREGFMRGTDDEPPCFFPGRAPEVVGLQQVLRTLRESGESAPIAERLRTASPAAEEALNRMEAAMWQALEGLTLKDLAGTGADVSHGDDRRS